MEKYIDDSLAASLIRPSSSPVGAGLFFVAKKNVLCGQFSFAGHHT